jgi:hypothetical protein
MILYILAIFIVVIILFYIFIKLRYRFWYLQPVNHYYNWFCKRGIILSDLPQKTKYVNSKNVRTYNFQKLHENDLKHILSMLELTKDKFQPHFAHTSQPSFISIYLKNELLTTSNHSLPIERQKIVGCITSRIVNVTINGYNLDAYYLDYLHAKKLDVEEQLFQTHEYNQSHSNKSVAVSLFRRETRLPSIIPAVKTKIYNFNLLKWFNPDPLDGCLSLVVGDKQNIYYFYNFFKALKIWSLSVIPDMSNIMEQITTNNLYVIMIMESHDIKAVYVFKHINTTTLCLLSSIQDKIETSDFIGGFFNSVKKIVEKHVYTNLLVEDLSFNGRIIDKILVKWYPTSIKDVYYYWYNYCCPTTPGQKTFIIV